MSVRQKIVEWALWGVRNAAEVHYAQNRPIDGIHKPAKLPLHTDCSGFVTDCYSWAGAPDPNGKLFSGQGYTGDILAHCHCIRESDLLHGDLVVFGPGTGSHVIVMVANGPGGNVVSHGSKKHGPNRYSLAAAKTYFPPPVRPLRCPGMGALVAGEAEIDSTAPCGLAAGTALDPNGSNPPVGK